jgi:hypothetical protein
MLLSSKRAVVIPRARARDVANDAIDASPPSRPSRLDQTVPDLPPVRRLSLFVASVQASMGVNELDDLSRARKSQTTQTSSAAASPAPVP